MNNEREPIMENSQLKSLARQQLRGNWGKAILVFLIYSIICYLISLIPAQCNI